MTKEFLNHDPSTRPIDVCAIENALVDLLVRGIDADLQRLGMNKGIMRLVDAATQAQVLANLGSRPAEIEVGGSAANALRGLATLGAQTSYSSLVGKDKYGESFSRRLRELSIMNRLHLSDSPTGTCLVVVTPDGERTMNTHLGACREYRKELVPVEDIRKSKIFFTTAYCWDTLHQIEAIELAIRVARDSGARMALDVADPFAVSRSRDVFARLIDSGDVNILFANAEESQMLVGCRGQAAAEALSHKVDVVAIKDGANGAYVAYAGRISHIPAIPTTVVDTTGAGDMFAGGFLYGLIRGYSIDLCGKIGAMLAADTISYLGVRLSSDIGRRVAELVE